MPLSAGLKCISVYRSQIAIMHCRISLIEHSTLEIRHESMALRRNSQSI